ncbi:MAG: hypothetical protein ACTSRI_18115 [Promethearchaeota archaeon]
MVVSLNAIFYSDVTEFYLIISLCLGFIANIDEMLAIFLNISFDRDDLLGYFTLLVLNCVVIWLFGHAFYGYYFQISNQILNHIQWVFL